MDETTKTRLLSGASLGGLGWFAIANPALGIPLLLSMGPAALSALFAQSPKVLQEKIAALMTPENIEKTTGQFYQQGLGSPAYSQAQANIATGANQTANTLAASLAARGIGQTGTGAILNSLTPSIVGNQQADLQAKMYTQAQNAAMQNIKDRIAQLQGIATQGPSQTMQLFGAGLDAMSPYVQQYLQTKYPKVYGPKNTGQPKTGAQEANQENPFGGIPMGFESYGGQLREKRGLNPIITI